eukprot:COSAG01_NODE_25641_length_738_cov_1.892019_1_plen_200_part_01
MWMGLAAGQGRHLPPEMAPRVAAAAVAMVVGGGDGSIMAWLESCALGHYYGAVVQGLGAVAVRELVELEEPVLTAVLGMKLLERRRWLRAAAAWRHPPPPPPLSLSRDDGGSGDRSEEESAAAVAVQALARGRSQRRAWRSQQAAAVRIQRVRRGQLGRRHTAVRMPAERAERRGRATEGKMVRGPVGRGGQRGTAVAAA